MSDIVRSNSFLTAGGNMPDGDYSYQDLPKHFRVPYERLCESTNSAPSECVAADRKRLFAKAVLRSVKERGDRYLHVIRKVSQEYPLALKVSQIDSQEEKESIWCDLNELIQTSPLAECHKQEVTRTLSVLVDEAFYAKDTRGVVREMALRCMKEMLRSECVQRAGGLEKHHENAVHDDVMTELRGVPALLTTELEYIAEQIANGNNASTLRRSPGPKLGGSQIDDIPL